MEINCLLVPTLALDLSLLQRLTDSIDCPIINKVVINNGRGGALAGWNVENPEWKVVDSGYNKGCAGAWNMAPIEFAQDHWLISNDDQVFQPGALERIYKAIEENKNAHVIYVNQHEAYDMFVWTRRALNDFGKFDENFYPIYYEDWEYRLRLNLGKADIHIIDKDFPVKHGKKAAGAGYMKMLKYCDPINRDYFMRKWGVIGDKNPAFSTPFNSGKPISWWELERDNRQMRREITDEYFESAVSFY